MAKNIIQLIIFDYRFFLFYSFCTLHFTYFWFFFLLFLARAFFCCLTFLLNLLHSTRIVLYEFEFVLQLLRLVHGLLLMLALILRMKLVAGVLMMVCWCCWWWRRWCCWCEWRWWWLLPLYTNLCAFHFLSLYYPSCIVLGHF